MSCEPRTCPDPWSFLGVAQKASQSKGAKSANAIQKFPKGAVQTEKCAQTMFEPGVSGFEIWNELSDTIYNSKLSSPEEVVKVSDASKRKVPLEEEATKSTDPSLCKTPSKDTDVQRAWMMTIPSSFFGGAEEWGRLRDAHVRFEPERIIIEAHDRFGRSKILHCCDIPRRLDTDSSTYKVDPAGKSVQISLKTFKSPRRASEALKPGEKNNDLQDRTEGKGTTKGSHRVVKPRGVVDLPSTANDFF